MLYNYYMKILIKILGIIGLACGLFPYANAQITVVKQDGPLIYLDTSDFNRTVSVGNDFKIILSKEKLTNPKTGKDLGLINHYSPVGKIIEVQPLYAIGKLPDHTTVTLGQEAIIEIATDVNPQASAAQQPPQTNVSTRKTKTYQVLEREIIGAVQADLTDQPGEEIAALDNKGILIIYAADGNVLQELMQFKFPAGQKPLSLSAKDVMQTGKAQLFIPIYKEQEQKIFTLVFETQPDQLTQIASVPYFVKELGCDVHKEIYAQKPFISDHRPGNAYKLIYRNGQFKTDKTPLKTRKNWLTGLNRYEIQNKDTENFIYTASNGRLRLQLANGKITESPALFATAANRVKYKQEILSFYPSLQVYGPQGQAEIAGIENTAKFGLLSEQFGQYNGGKLHFLTYENGVLAIQETVELSGFAYDTHCTAGGILIPQVVSGGQTILTEIYR